MNESIASEAFPLWALLPKRETNVESFLQKHPEYDGRGIKIAIFDTGVDPGAAGLQVTTDGKPKIIDMIDATGAGDVDTSTIVEVDQNGFITGLTGTQLKVPTHWTNPSGKYHIGVINIYDLYPTPLRRRMTKEYTENEWQPQLRTLNAEAVRQLQDFQKNHLNSSGDTPNDKLIREDLQSKVDFLRSVRDFKDLGPTFDCIVFNDGNHWKGVIDTTGAGKLEGCTLLGNYRECLKYGTISERDIYNYGLNIYDEGNLMEIVGPSAEHGTHVASIAAAQFPTEPIKNGIAPGAQIVSVCVSDKRLDSRLTESALIRGLIKAIESNCQVINLSYRVFVKWPEGRVLDLIDEVANKYRIIFVTSAGNDGPALTSVGINTTMKSSSVISVGAYITPDMMIGGHSLRSRMPEMAYSFTSRGPTINGDLGVNLCAPGGAITSVPNFELKKAEMMWGTSMSSPNVAGSICLLLSGLDAQNIEYSPYSLRRSLENTALKVLNYEPFTHGHGLIQVEKAFEHLTQFKNTMERDVRFLIRSGNNLGIYLRQWHEVQSPSTHLISIEPIFLNDKQMGSFISKPN